jgi:hypothetical protein
MRTRLLRVLLLVAVYAVLFQSRPPAVACIQPQEDCWEYAEVHCAQRGGVLYNCCCHPVPGDPECFAWCVDDGPLPNGCDYLDQPNVDCWG